MDEAVTAFDVEQTLDAVQLWHAEQVRLEVRIFVAAAHYADLHRPDTRRHGAGPVLKGMEQPTRLGGPGTPLVWEFAAATFGPRIGVSPYAARALLADALDTRHRLPRLWRRVSAGEVPVRLARHVAQQTRDLSAEAAGHVDATVATYADGRVSWSRFATMVAGAVVAADPERATRLEREAAEQEFAKVGRSNDHGQKTLYVRSGAAAMIKVDASIAFYADILAALGDVDDEDRRRAKAVLILANPEQALHLLQAFAAHRANTGSGDSDDGAAVDDPLDLDDDPDAEADDPADTAAAFSKPFRPHQITSDTRFTLGFDPAKLLPQVTLYLHLYADPATGDVGPVARWEGEGPISTAYLRDVLGPACRFTLKPVINPAGMAPVDGNEVPDRHREAVHLHTPADIFPFASHTGRGKQQDHTEAYVPPDEGGPPGQTGLHNLGPMTQFHHRVKTHSPWQVKQPFPGIYLWRDPYGHMLLVDHTGTRPLGTTDTRTGTGTDPPDITADIYPATDHIELHHDYHHAS